MEKLCKNCRWWQTIIDGDYEPTVCTNPKFDDMVNPLWDTAGFATNPGFRCILWEDANGPAAMRTWATRLSEDIEPRMPPCVPMYAIGQDDGKGGYGMWDGPNPSLEEMLDVDGRDKDSVIIRFNVDGTDEVMYRWICGDWMEEGY